MNLSDRYAKWLEDGGRSRVCETPPPMSLQVAREIPEAELQARWFAGEFGQEFVTIAGEPVTIVSFGEWNREPGSVFAQAQISFRGERPVRGGIEVQADPCEWERRISPEYEETLLHVFAGGGVGGFGGIRGGRKASAGAKTAAGRVVAQVALDVTPLEFGKTEGSGNSACCAPLSSLGEEVVEELLEAAAQYRLCRKAARLARLCRQSGAGEGLYQALAETLGYRYNKLPFTLLAQRFPLALLRKRIGEIEPLLFAGSGFLPSMDLGAMPDDTRGYLRDIWARWWPQRTEFERLSLPASLWTLGGARPVNHPQRRVAALGEIVRNWPIIESLASSCDVAAIRGFFAGLRHGYWDAHYTLTSQRSRTRMALVGETRVTDMLANVFFPAAIAAAPQRWKVYRKLPALDSNQKLEEAAGRLFGPARSPQVDKLLKQAVCQQGLLQLYEDHCLDCALECARCRLPERLERWRG